MRDMALAIAIIGFLMLGNSQHWVQCCAHKVPVNGFGIRLGSVLILNVMCF
jgi:hypothetical protein